MNHYQRYLELHRSHNPMKVLTANKYGVYTPMRVYESDVKRYAVLYYQMGLLPMMLLFSGPEGLARWREEEFSPESGDKVVRVVDLDHGEDIPFGLQLEVAL